MPKNHRFVDDLTPTDVREAQRVATLERGDDAPAFVPPSGWIATRPDDETNLAPWITRLGLTRWEAAYKGTSRVVVHVPEPEPMASPKAPTPPAVPFGLGDEEKKPRTRPKTKRGSRGGRGRGKTSRAALAKTTSMGAAFAKATSGRTP